ncbi:hypothetical protein M569_07726, partial [Genlisea aurea]
RSKYAESGDAREMSYKRQRLMDHGSPYYGVPAPNYIFNALAPPPAYSYSGPPFPVVRLRGLPYDCSESEIIDFFRGLDVIDMLFVHKGGKFTGEAYCVLGYPLQIDFALQKNRHNIGRRYVEVFRSGKEEYYKAIANEVHDTCSAASPRRPAPRARSVEEVKDSSDFSGLLRLRGLPYSVTREEIRNFFEDFNLPEESIHLITSSEGRPAGEAIVEFSSAKDSVAAMAKDRMTLGYRYVELYPASREELEEATSRGRIFYEAKEERVGAAPPSRVLRMRGLPYSAGKDDILDFFGSFRLSEESIQIVLNHDGKPTGEALVEFSSTEDAAGALGKDRMTLGSRYIELFPSSP